MKKVELIKVILTLLLMSITAKCQIAFCSSKCTMELEASGNVNPYCQNTNMTKCLKCDERFF